MIMADESPIFVVDQTGERTVVRFRDWRAARTEFFQPVEPELLAKIRQELEAVDADCRVLAVDMSEVDLVPSSFLAMLVAIHRGGTKVELLDPSQPVRDVLHTTRLNQLLLVRDKTE
jgi:hypothetical protein